MRYACDYNTLEKIDTPEKAQIIGILLADGCIYEKKNAVKLALIEDDLPYLNNIKSIFKCDKPLYCDNRKGKRFYKEHNKTYSIKNSYTLSLNNNKLMNDCINLGILPNKTYKNFGLPKIEKSYMNSLVLGLFEGDGCISIAYNLSKTTDSKYLQYKVYLLLTNQMLEDLNPIF